ncbi:hypothetical protein [Actinokineospora diospyrosa]|uniref:Uncharacterized protein n=1 Tax=Actinokineospora diospyrosa TaxID=103728 RepID=A0ABT1IIZ7_9PSEU|nr:hypothetical protein [Actinokineospora diospyrosa]MCP2272176.1 hypothetical protein [Actinokineospora diospyrosa]
MSQEGGSERTQRTVAELLAKYGGNSGDGAPRRRRRKPDDASETAPQAIIDRVMSDSGKLLPIREDQPPHERATHRQDRSQVSQQLPLPTRRARPEQPPVDPRARPRIDPQPPTQQHPPVAPPHNAPPHNAPPHNAPPHAPPVDPRQLARPAVDPRQQPRPDEQRQPVRGEDPRPPVRQEPVRHEPPRQEPVRQELVRQEPPRQDAPRQDDPRARPPDPREQHQPVTAARRPDVGEPHTEQLPRVPADDQAPDPAEPPAGLAPNRAPLPRRVAGGGRRPQPTQQNPVPPQVSQPLPVPPPQVSQPLPVPQVSQPLPVPPRGPGYRGDFPGDSAQTAVDPSGPPPEFHEDFTGFDDKAATRFTDYSAHDEFARGAERGGVDLDEDDLDDRFDEDGFDEDDRDKLDDDGDDEPESDEEPRSAGREWLIMVGQLGLGVVGGAVVWLIFNWLWRVLPAAALVGALAVIVGLVLIVRKVRRAEDLQTTVLAVLVGLLVTVSPAALLLLGR